MRQSLLRADDFLELFFWVLGSEYSTYNDESFGKGCVKMILEGSRARGIWEVVNLWRMNKAT
jgi:hypothetical protein